MENNVTKKSLPPYVILGLIALIAGLILLNRAETRYNR